MNFDTLLHKHNETGESQFPRTPGHMTAVFTSTGNAIYCIQQS